MGQASESYCTLIRWLAERNRLSSVELRYILRSPEPVNPGDLLLNSTSIDVHAIKIAYRRLTERGLDWKTIQERLADIIEYRLWLEKNRQNARKETELLYPIGDLVMKPNIGILPVHALSSSCSGYNSAFAWPTLTVRPVCSHPS